jgi:hypothetical protein
MAGRYDFYIPDLLLFEENSRRMTDTLFCNKLSPNREKSFEWPLEIKGTLLSINLPF